jgi:hypothetical protein
MEQSAMSGEWLNGAIPAREPKQGRCSPERQASRSKLRLEGSNANSQARVLGFHAGANPGRLLRATVLGMRTSLKF